MKESTEEGSPKYRIKLVNPITTPTTMITEPMVSTNSEKDGGTILMTSRSVHDREAAGQAQSAVCPTVGSSVKHSVTDRCPAGSNSCSTSIASMNSTTQNRKRQRLPHVDYCQSIQQHELSFGQETKEIMQGTPVPQKNLHHVFHRRQHQKQSDKTTLSYMWRILYGALVGGVVSAICLRSMYLWNPTALEKLSTILVVPESSSYLYNILAHTLFTRHGNSQHQESIENDFHSHPNPLKATKKHIKYEYRHTDGFRRTGPLNAKNFSDGVRYYLDLFQGPHHHRTTTTTMIEDQWQLDSLSQVPSGQQVLFSSTPTRRLAGDSSYPSSSSSSSSGYSSSSESSPSYGGYSPSSSSNEGASTKSGSGSNSGSSNGHMNKDSFKDAQLVIAGKMSVKDAPCNIAEFNLKLNEWSLDERIQLSLYNSYSGGEVYMLLANHTNSKVQLDSQQQQQQQQQQTTQQQLHEEASKSRGTQTSSSFEGSGELIVVGAFDTTYRNSQVTYCSVGMWDGQLLSKVGEGLCNSALSKGMKITTAALAGPQDVYVAGSFQTQVWNGDLHEFVKIYNIAHYNAVDQVWMPLNIGQITCSWCTVTVLALAWDSKRRCLHIAGKFNAIDGRNVPAGLAVYDMDSGHLVAHPGGGLSMRNATQDGVGTALQLDEESGVLYVMGSYERLTATGELCYGLAAYEINTNRWTCLADSAHTVQPTGGGNMLLTPFGLMVAGKVSGKTTWLDDDRPYTIALLKATLKTHEVKEATPIGDDDFYISDDDTTPIQKSTKANYGSGSSSAQSSSLRNDKRSNNTIVGFRTKKETYHEFDWSWLPGFEGHDEPLHALSNGFGDHTGAVFIAGDNLVAKWSYQQRTSGSKDDNRRKLYQSSGGTSSSSNQPRWVAVTENLSGDSVRGAIMAISQMMPEPEMPKGVTTSTNVNITIIIYCVAAGCVIGMFIAIMWNRNFSSSVFPCFGDDNELKGISLDTLTYSALENTNITDAYQRAMKTRYVQHPHLLTIIDPQEIFLQRIIGEGTFGRVWSAKWRSASVAVKEFVFAQAAVAGKSSMQQEIVEEIIGEAGMMAILRHPNVLQLFGCSLTAQAIWIVSELCSLGSLRQVLDDNDRSLPLQIRINLALQVAEGMTYLHNQDPPIIHRDLKSHNIFVHETFTDSDGGEDPRKSKKHGQNPNDSHHIPWWKPQKMTTHSTLVAKIGDWGSARATLSGSRTMTHGVGTACWLAPEVIKHARSSKYSDVYGYGIILWELSTREEVYQGLETTQIIAKVANESLRPPVPQDCPWKDVMVQCWAENPHDRPEFSEIVVGLNDDREEIDKQLAESSNTDASETDAIRSDDCKTDVEQKSHTTSEEAEEGSTEEESPETSPLLGADHVKPATAAEAVAISPASADKTKMGATRPPTSSIPNSPTTPLVNNGRSVASGGGGVQPRKRGFFSSVLRNARGND